MRTAVLHRQASGVGRTVDPNSPSAEPDIGCAGSRRGAASVEVSEVPRPRLPAVAQWRPPWPSYPTTLALGSPEARGPWQSGCRLVLAERTRGMLSDTVADHLWVGRRRWDAPQSSP